MDWRPDVPAERRAKIPEGLELFGSFDREDRVSVVPEQVNETIRYQTIGVVSPTHLQANVGLIFGRKKYGGMPRRPLCELILASLVGRFHSVLRPRTSASSAFAAVTGIRRT